MLVLTNALIAVSRLTLIQMKGLPAVSYVSMKAVMLEVYTMMENHTI